MFPTSNSTRCTFLPEDYTVGPQDVIIGRGKRCLNNAGNIRFKAIIQTTLQSYSDAETKLKKSSIIMQVLNQIRGTDGAGFVKRDSATGRYTQVEEASSRIAIAQAFRDALHGTYKSSKKYKQVRRLERRAEPEPVSRSIFDESLDPVPISKLVEPTACDSMGFCRSASGFSMMQLRGILNEATSAVATKELEASTLNTGSAFPQSNPDDVFVNLYTAFGTQLGAINTEDPFEPRPIADDNSLLKHL